MPHTTTKPLETTKHLEWRPPAAFPHAKLTSGSITATGQNSHHFQAFEETMRSLAESPYLAVWRYADYLVESFVVITRRSVSCPEDAAYTNVNASLLHSDDDTYYHVDFHHLSGTHNLRLNTPHVRVNPGDDDEPSRRYQLQLAQEHINPPCFANLRDAWEYAAFLAVESGLTPPNPTGSP